MHDIRAIRDNPGWFNSALAKRGLAPMAERLLELDAQTRAASAIRQDAEAGRNESSRLIGAAMKNRDTAEAERLKAGVEVLRAKIEKATADEEASSSALLSLLEGIPNLPADTVPLGEDEHGNVEVRRWGTPRSFSFPIKGHVDLGAGLGLMDFSAATAMSGARFVVLKGALARLERALAAFMIDHHTMEAGYQEVAPPLLVRAEAVYGVGQLPKFEDDLFKTTDGRWLTSTAEVSLSNLVREQILKETDLPLRFSADTPCFRSEAGAAGRDTRGMIRMHQFRKVEMVSVTTPEASAAEHERMTNCAEEILRRLELPYRVLLLCTGDMGFASEKTYDLEVWVPSEDRYREISSCSNCGAFQARRLGARYRPVDGKPQFVHTLNGSGLAVGRTLVALLENHQQEDGSIRIPEALRPWMGGLDRIA
jgi:seryl-tRNA synthetase